MGDVLRKGFQVDFELISSVEIKKKILWKTNLTISQTRISRLWWHFLCVFFGLTDLAAGAQAGLFFTSTQTKRIVASSLGAPSHIQAPLRRHRHRPIESGLMQHTGIRAPIRIR